MRLLQMRIDHKNGTVHFGKLQLESDRLRGQHLRCWRAAWPQAMQPSSTLCPRSRQGGSQEEGACSRKPLVFLHMQQWVPPASDKMSRKTSAVHIRGLCSRG